MLIPNMFLPLVINFYFCPMKKQLLFILLICSVLVANAMADNDGISSVFWGWSYSSPSSVMSEGGTGNCFQEVTARHYIFWIGGDTQTMYRYADCSTGKPIGDWCYSLMGHSNEQ